MLWSFQVNVGSVQTSNTEQEWSKAHRRLRDCTAWVWSDWYNEQRNPHTLPKPSNQTHITTYHEIQSQPHQSSHRNETIEYSFKVCCHFSKVPLKSSNSNICGCDFSSSAEPAPSAVAVYTRQSALSMPGRHHFSDAAFGQCLKEKIRQAFLCSLSVARSRNHLFFLSHADRKRWNSAREINIHTTPSPSLCLPFNSVFASLTTPPLPKPRAPCRELDKPLEAQ